MDLDEVIAFQHKMGFDDIHVVYFDVGQFRLAHTDLERDLKHDIGFNLFTCPVHEWLSTLPGPPAIGIYAITAAEGTGYPWQLHPIEIEPIDEE